MKSATTILGLLAASSMIAATPARAESVKDGARCSGSGFSTCASSQVRIAGNDLSFRGSGVSGTFETDRHSLRIGDGRDGSTPPTLPGPGDHEATPCPDGPRHEAECATPTTVTPEPVTMTLLATGLMGIMGISRRRKQPQ